MTPFEALELELDQWNFAGEEAMLWWRDDDAMEDSDALQQLLAVSAKYDVPLALAVIPRGLTPSLGKSLAGNDLVQVLQHGIGHQNLAAQDRKKQELTVCADQRQLESDMAEGMAALRTAFPEEFLPVMVPPWNRIDPELFPVLAQLGYLGLSCYQPRSRPEVAPDVWLINTHVDVVDWKHGKQFVGEQQAIELMVAHLQAKRSGEADRAEPTGLLTHHLDHDKACWEFLDRLLAVLDEHPAVTWLSPERVFQTRWRQ